VGDVTHNARRLAVLPYLSVVVASRNDDHGGDPLIRTQICINNFARQCEKHRLPAELIIVDWNPVPERPGLAAVLHLPPEATYLQSRVVTVPSALHRRLKYAEQLPFFQMIAKNVGIRRAKGKFVLATNIDILFSDELFQFIARQRLDPKKQYRVDRYDIRSGLTQKATLEEALDYAWSYPIRNHRRYQPESLVQHLYGNEHFKKSCSPGPRFRGKHEGVDVVREEDVWQVRPERSVNMTHLHTNACGDFTLLSREGWLKVRGYPEFEAFSFNIDSIGFVAAHYGGYEEVSLLPPCVCFHIEHGVGSGWTPEGEKQLFSRLEKARILNPEWPVLMPLVEEMQDQAKQLEFNHANWGLAEFELPEQMLGDTTPIARSELERLAVQAETHPVSSIQSTYDLDRLTLAYERRYGPLALAAYAGKVVLYIPNSHGIYSEARSISQNVEVLHTGTAEFVLERYAQEFPLRFDPCQCAGLITVYSMTVLDKNKKMVWELNGRNAGRVTIGGTAMRANGAGWKQKLFSSPEINKGQPLRIISTGVDPQLILPRLPHDIEFPVVLSISISVAPCK
jgi:hypothetical protein